MTDAATFARNINKHFPPDKQRPYFGFVLAMSDDGTNLLAHARTYDELYEELERRGITDYVIYSNLADFAPSLNGAATVNSTARTPE